MNRRRFIKTAAAGLFLPELFARAQMEELPILRAASKQQLGAASGGGGGGTYTFGSKATAFGGSSAATTGATTTGANLIVAVAGFYSGSASLADSKSNSYQALTKWTDQSGNYNSQIFYCLSPTVGSSHTFTLTASLCVLCVLWFTKSGGSPAFDTQNGLSYSGGNTSTFQPGNITPAGSNEVFVTGFCTDKPASTSPIPATINSSYVTDSTYQLQEGGNNLYSGAAYFINTGSSAENPTWTPNATIDTLAASHAAFK